MELTKRVLSVQSHVVHGYVGNKAATFPLQLLGWDVDAINTVQFSNHAGYQSHGGSKADGAQLLDIFTALERNEFTQTDALLSGYIPGAEALSVVADFAAHLRAKNPDLPFVLDPVMGDDGKLYVADDVVPVYRDKLLPLATIITPNWFEVELLTKIQLKSRDSLRSALNALHTLHGVRHVVITSTIVRQGSKLLNEITEANLVAGFGFSMNGLSVERTVQDELILCISSSVSDDDEFPIVHALAVPRLKGYFSGVGDLFSALVLAHYDASPSLPTNGATPELPTSALSRAASRALHTTQAVIRRTQDHLLSLASASSQDSASASADAYTDDELDAREPLRRVRRMRTRELRLIQSRDDILACAGKNEKVEEMRPWRGFWRE